MNTVSLRPPQDWKRARVTLALAAATTAVWLIVALLGILEPAVIWGAFIPARFSVFGADPGLAPAWLTPLTAAFLHANFIHLAFNLLILAFCGRATEPVLGPVGFALLYLVGAYAAAGAHYLIDPTSLNPMIGASGAISAVLGAYAVLFGRNKVKVRSPRLALLLHVLWLMAAWIVLQLIVVYTFARWFGALVAVGAHIGGFVAGAALAVPLLLLRYRKA